MLLSAFSVIVLRFPRPPWKYTSVQSRGKTFDALQSFLIFLLKLLLGVVLLACQNGINLNHGDGYIR